jgi:predicted dehydrogenase
MYSPYVKQDEPLKVECQHFLDCIKTGDAPISGAEESLRVVQILEASSLSLKNGGNKTEVKKVT